MTDSTADTPHRATARGTTKIAAAQLITAGVGVIIHVYLARALAPELYGVLAVVVSVIAWWQWTGVALLASSTAHFVARAQDKWRQVAGTAVQTAMVWSLVLAAGSAASAPLVARALRDTSLTGYLWLFSLDLALYPLFHILVQVSRGRRRYGHYTGALIVYWVVKAGLVCGLVALGLSVRGAILGSIGGSVAGIAVAWWWSGVGLPRGGFPALTLIRFGLPLMALAVAMRVIESMDLWSVQALLPSAQAPGYYGAAKYVYYAALMLPAAVAAAMFPTLTQAIAANNKASRRELIEQSFRFAFVTMFATLALLGSTATGVVTLVFSAPYAAAAVPAVVLAGAALMSSLQAISNSILVAAGKPGLCLAALVPWLPVNIGLNLFLVPRYELLGAASATVITGTLAAVTVLVLVWREFGVLFSWPSLLRILAAAVVVYTVGLFIPASGVLVLVKLLGLLGVYLLLLMVTGELTRRDLAPLIFWRG